MYNMFVYALDYLVKHVVEGFGHDQNTGTGNKASSKIEDWKK